MSTRATYRFLYKAKTLDVYVHHDGYPLGAAAKLLNAYTPRLADPDNHYDDGLHGDLATRFIRHNDRAEITQDADLHGDRAYHYEITLPLSPYGRPGDDPDAVQVTVWRHGVVGDTCYHSGSLRDFIEFEYEKAGKPPAFVEIERHGLGTTPHVVSVAQVRRYIQQKQATLNAWGRNGHTTSTNYTILTEEVATLRAALAGIVPATV